MIRNMVDNGEKGGYEIENSGEIKGMEDMKRYGRKYMTEKNYGLQMKPKREMKKEHRTFHKIAE